MSDGDDAMDLDEPVPQPEKKVVKEKVSFGKKERDASSSSLPWVEKYRPSSLDELISHDHIIQTRPPSLSALIRPPALP